MNNSRTIPLSILFLLVFAIGCSTRPERIGFVTAYNGAPTLSRSGLIPFAYAAPGLSVEDGGEVVVPARAAISILVYDQLVVEAGDASMKTRVTVYTEQSIGRRIVHCRLTEGTIHLALSVEGERKRIDAVRVEVSKTYKPTLSVDSRRFEDQVKAKSGAMRVQMLGMLASPDINIVLTGTTVDLRCDYSKPALYCACEQSQIHIEGMMGNEKLSLGQGMEIPLPFDGGSADWQPLPRKYSREYLHGVLASIRRMEDIQRERALRIAQGDVEVQQSWRSVNRVLGFGPRVPATNWWIP